MSEVRHIYSSELSDYAANPDGSIFYGIDTGKLYVKEGDEFHVHEEDSVDAYNFVGWTDDTSAGWDVAQNRWVGAVNEGSTPADWQNYDIWKLEPILFTLNHRVTNAENLRGLLGASDAGYNSRPIPFTISGPDAAHFQILHGFSQLHGSSPLASDPYYLALTEPLDYDAPVDANGDNKYEVTVTAHDTSGNSSSRVFELEVTNNGSDDAPRWDGYSPGSSTYNIIEGTDVQIANLVAAPADRYEISGPDAAKFKVASSAPFSLTTNGTLDYENPSDVADPAGDNQYQITITAYNDAAGGATPPSSSHTFIINVLNDNAEDAPIWAGTSGSYNWAGGEDVLVDNIPAKMFTATYEENVTGYLFPAFSTHNPSFTNFTIVPWSQGAGYGRDAQHFELVGNQLKFKDGFVADFENPGDDPASNVTPDNIYYVTIRAENVNSPQLFSDKLFKVVITNNTSETGPSFKDYNNNEFGYNHYQGAYVIDPPVIGLVSNKAIVATDATLTQGSRTITTNSHQVFGWLNPGDSILIGPGSGMPARVVLVEPRGARGAVTPLNSTYPGIIAGDSTTPGATITIDRDYTFESVTDANIELIESAYTYPLHGPENVQEVKEAQYAYFINTVGSNGAYTSQHGQVTFDEGTPSGASHNAYTGGADGARFLIKTEGSAWNPSSGTTNYANNIDGLLIRPDPASMTNDSDIIHRGFTGLNFNLTAPRTIHAWEREGLPNRTDRILQTQLNIENLGLDTPSTATLNTQIHVIPRYKWLVSAYPSGHTQPELNSNYNFNSTRFGINKNYTPSGTELFSGTQLDHAQQEEFWGPESGTQPTTGWTPFTTTGKNFTDNVGFGIGAQALDGISYLRYHAEGSWIQSVSSYSGRGQIGQNVPNSDILRVNGIWSLGVEESDSTQWCMQSKLPAPGRDIRSVLSHLGLGNTRDNSILQLYGTSGGWANVGDAKGTGFILFKQQYANSNFINYTAQQNGLLTHTDQGFNGIGDTGPINFGDSTRRVYCHIKDFIIQGYYEHYYVYVKDATVIDPINTAGPSNVTLFDTADEAHNAAWGNYKRFSWYGPTTHVIDGEPARWETHGGGDGDNADKLLGAHVFEHSVEQNYDPEHGADDHHWWSPVFDKPALHAAANAGSATGAWILLEPTGNPNRYRNSGPEYYSDNSATGTGVGYDYGQFWYACRIDTDSISAGGFNIGATTGDVVLNSTPHHSHANWPQTTY